MRKKSLRMSIIVKFQSPKFKVSKMFHKEKNVSSQTNKHSEEKEVLTQTFYIFQQFLP